MRGCTLVAIYFRYWAKADTPLAAEMGARSGRSQPGAGEGGLGSTAVMASASSQSQIGGKQSRDRALSADLPHAILRLSSETAKSLNLMASEFVS